MDLRDDDSSNARFEEMLFEFLRRQLPDLVLGLRDTAHASHKVQRIVGIVSADDEASAAYLRQNPYSARMLAIGTHYNHELKIALILRAPETANFVSGVSLLPSEAVEAEPLGSGDPLIAMAGYAMELPLLKGSDADKVVERITLLASDNDEAVSLGLLLISEAAQLVSDALSRYPQYPGGLAGRAPETARVLTLNGDRTAATSAFRGQHDLAALSAFVESLARSDAQECKRLLKEIQPFDTFTAMAFERLDSYAQMLGLMVADDPDFGRELTDRMPLLAAVVDTSMNNLAKGVSDGLEM